MNLHDIILDGVSILGVIGEDSEVGGGSSSSNNNQQQTATIDDQNIVDTENLPRAPSTGSLISTAVLWVGALAFAWFLLFRQPKKERQKKEELRESIKIGDNIVTIGGLYGKVVDVGTDVFVVEFGTNRGIRVPINKESVEGIKDPILTPPPRN